jgi:protein-S-isoprenylcysteine O-methyltransferase Ste14
MAPLLIQMCITTPLPKVFCVMGVLLLTVAGNLFFGCMYLLATFLVASKNSLFQKVAAELHYAESRYESA